MGADAYARPVGRLHRIGIGIAVFLQSREKLVAQMRMRAAVAAALNERQMRVLAGIVDAAQREALMLVGANGYSYDHAAKLAGCAVGTMKSRVSRARSRLNELLQLDPASGVALTPPAPD